MRESRWEVLRAIGRDSNQMLADPVPQVIQQFGSNLGIFAPGAGGHVKGMVRILKELESRPGAEFLAERFHKLQIGELIVSSFQKQHRNLHVDEVFSAFVRGLAGWMKRESEKHQAPHSGQR